MRSTLSIACTLVALLAASQTQVLAQAPLDSAFLYQGQLKETGISVNESADFRFRLYDASAGGSQVGSTVYKLGVNVVNGLFNAELDFGVSPFDGDARWLDIAVRVPAHSGSYVPLSPRQPLDATPYALQTRGLYVDADLEVGIGTTDPLDRLHVANGDLRVDGDLMLYEGANRAVWSYPFPEGKFWSFENAATGWVAADMGTSNADGAGFIHLRAADGAQIGVELDGDGDDLDNGITAGLIQVRSAGTGGLGGEVDVQNNDGNTRISMLGGGSSDGGTVEMYNSVGDITILLDGEAGTGADLRMLNDDGIMTIDLDSDNSDAGTIGVTNGVSSSLKVELDGDGGGDDGGHIYVRATDGSSTVFLDGQASNDGGLVSVRNDTSEDTISMFGDDGTNAGVVFITNRDDSLNVSTIVLDAQEDEYGTGARIVGRAESGSVTFELDTSDTATGGAFMDFHEQDGSIALSYSALTKTLRMFDSAGTATISFNSETGGKSAVVTTPDYGQRLLYAVESPEVWFEDFGSGQLVNGRVRIDLDPIFLQTVTVSEQHPLKVFITLTDECNGVFVKKGSDHFTVCELARGKSNATFDWRVVAKRKGLEDLRLEQLDPAIAGVASESMAVPEPAPLRVPNDDVDDPEARLEEEQNVAPQRRAPSSGQSGELRPEGSAAQAAGK